MRAVVWAILVIVVGAGLWWASWDDEAQPVVEPTDPTTEPQGPRAGPELTAAGRARDATAPEPPPAETATPDDDLSPVRHVLEGRLIGFDPALPGRAVITVTGLTAEYQPPKTRPEGTAKPDGSFSIDVTPVFDSDKTIVDLQVNVDHPGYMPVKTRVAVTAAAAPKGPRRYRARIPLTRAGIITGRVETPRGDPAKASVAAFLLREGKPKSFPSVETDDDGRYRLRVGHKGHYVVIAAMKGHAPAQGEASLVPGTEVDVPALVIEPGVTIRGKVLFHGATLAGAEVEAQRKQPDGAWFSVGRQRVVWANGRVFPAKTEATADDTGRFEVGGLRPGPHRVSVDSAPGLTVHMACSQDSEQVVEAPASDVVLKLEGCAITVAIVKGGTPVANPTLLLHARGVVSFTGDASGEVEILIPAGEPYYISVYGKNVPTRNVTLQAPTGQPTHREVIDLGSTVQKPVLVVTLVSPEGAQVEQAGFAFFEPGGSSLFARKTLDVKAKGGRFRIEGVPPGPHVMKVRPGGPWWGGHGFYLQEAVDVKVPADGEAQVRVPIHKGGRLRIAVRNPDGDFLSPKCTIRDAEGREIGASYVRRTEGGLTASYGSLGSGSISSVDPALPAGTYTISLAEDKYFPKTVTVEVVAGKAKDVEVELEPTR